VALPAEAQIDRHARVRQTVLASAVVIGLKQAAGRRTTPTARHLASADADGTATGRENAPWLGAG